MSAMKRRHVVLPHAICKVTVGSNPTLVEFKGRSDMMIKVPLTGGPIFTGWEELGKINRN